MRKVDHATCFLLELSLLLVVTTHILDLISSNLGGRFFTGVCIRYSSE